MNKSRKGFDKAQRKRQEILSVLRDSLLSVSSKLPPFGSKLGSINGCQAADVVVCHRVVNKFEEPKATDAATRREESIRSMLNRDVVPNINWSSDYLRMAKARLNVWWRGFKPSYRFRAPSGASARPFGDEQDIAVKLTELDNWEISPQLVEYATQIVWSNHALKRIVRQRFRERYPYLELNEHFRRKVGVNGYKIFKEMFKCLLTYNSVSRVETVPKDNNEDRVITCEPLWDMICQLSFMADMRDHMRTRLGYDVNTRGDLHKTLIPHDVATIDLSKASDFVSWELIRNVWPENMVRFLTILRPEVLFAQLGTEEVYHSLHMFAPMGTGVTFDVMTFSLLALLRGDKSASVFGDDIIVKQEYVNEALQAIEDAGLVVNRAKSFFKGSFRESCGGMYHDDTGYIVSYDIRWPETVVDVVTTINKLSLILAAKQVSFEVEGILARARDDLATTMPRDVFAARSLELSSSCVTGFNIRRPPHGAGVAIGVNWHRPCTFHRAFHVENQKSRLQVEPMTSLAMLLFTGTRVKPVRQKTRIVQRWVETWSETPIQSCIVSPITFM